MATKTVKVSVKSSVQLVGSYYRVKTSVNNGRTTTTRVKTIKAR